LNNLPIPLDGVAPEIDTPLNEYVYERQKDAHVKELAEFCLTTPADHHSTARGSVSDWSGKISG
jgi:hypothetical protein